MMEDEISYIEKYINAFVQSKSRVCVLILCVISIICSILFVTENNLKLLTVLYEIFMICTGISVITYITDIDSKNKYRNDILVVGVTLNFVGILLRILQVGLAFSIRFFISYCIFGIAMILFCVKLCKNNGREKIIIVLLLLMALYCLIEFTYASACYINGFTGTIYRIAEASLFLGYIGIVRMNRNKFQGISESLGGYKTQIPSLKVCFSIFVLIAITIIACGAVKNFDKISSGIKTVHKKETVTSNVEKSDQMKDAPEKEKSEKIEKNEKITSTIEKTEATIAPTKEPIKTISLGEKITTEDFDFTLNKVELTYEVKPENTSGVYSSYEAEKDMIYVHVDGSYYNKAKRDIRIRDLFVPVVEYDTGFSYEGFAVVDDDNRFDWVSSYVICTPLETCHYHGLVQCPEVVKNSDAPLKVKMEIGGTLYEHTMR